jgi:hypothetical protein
MTEDLHFAVVTLRAATDADYAFMREPSGATRAEEVERFPFLRDAECTAGRKSGKRFQKRQPACTCVLAMGQKHSRVNWIRVEILPLRDPAILCFRVSG